MPYANPRYKGVRTEDHDTYVGYPSEYMHNPKKQKSKVFGGEMLDFEDRKQLQYLYHETAIMRDINNVKKRRS